METAFPYGKVDVHYGAADGYQTVSFKLPRPLSDAEEAKLRETLVQYGLLAG